MLRNNVVLGAGHNTHYDGDIFWNNTNHALNSKRIAQPVSIQVDGGSEFMAEFEQACAELKIPLMVLPPKKPTYNGGVERTNRTFREEFYNQSRLLADSIGAMRIALKQALHKHNSYRPHFALNGATPFEYIQKHSEVLQSQIT